MLRSPYQFTIGRLVKLTVYFALVFWLIRTVGGPSFLTVFWAIDWIVHQRTKIAMGIVGSTVCRCLVFVGLAAAYRTYFYLFPGPYAAREWERPVSFLVAVLYIVAPICISAISRLYRAIIMGRDYRMPPTDSSCGPIVWRGFGDGPEPGASALQHKVVARSGTTAVSRS